MKLIRRYRYLLIYVLPLMILAGCSLILKMWLRWRLCHSDEEIPEEQIIEPTYEDHFVKIGQSCCHYTEYPATGKDILFIHGFASSTYTWEKVAPVLNKLGYHVWALDIKGFGWSDKPKDASYDILTLTEEVYQWMEALGLDDVVLVGNSLGGGITTLMALLHPEKVGRMVLIDAAAYNTKFPFIMELARLPLSAEMTKLFFSRWVVRQTLSEVYHHRDWIGKDQVDAYYERLRTDNALNAQIAVVRALEFSRVEKFVNRIPEIQSKALIIWGEHDRWIPLSSAYRFNAELRDSTLVVIPECGHMPQEEYPDFTARLIDAFIQDKPVTDIYDHESRCSVRIDASRLVGESVIEM
jgi:pimeloyl-ACP methyl ester carboxylesterase